MKTFARLPFLFASLCALACAAASSADDPLQLEPSDDTWLSSEHSGRAGGRGALEEFQLFGRNDATTPRVLLKFDLKQAPPGFKSAILHLHCFNPFYQQAATAFLRCHAVTSAWSEDSASWDQRSGGSGWTHPGGDWDPKPISGALLYGPIKTTVERDFDFDVTVLARQWQAQPGKNYGVAIMLEKGCVAQLRFRSKQFANAEQRPKLLLYYKQPASRDSMIVSGESVAPFEPYDPAAPAVSMGARPETLKLGEATETKFSATGAKEPYAFALASPPVPGLALTPDGTLKGKPSKAGAFILGVQCTAGNGKHATEWSRWIVADPNAKPSSPQPEARDASDKKPDEKKEEKKAEKPPGEAKGPKEE